jgi:hypothetical protein
MNLGDQIIKAKITVLVSFTLLIEKGPLNRTNDVWWTTTIFMF